MKGLLLFNLMFCCYTAGILTFFSIREKDWESSLGWLGLLGAALLRILPEFFMAFEELPLPLKLLVHGSAGILFYFSLHELLKDRRPLPGRVIALIILLLLYLSPLLPMIPHKEGLSLVDRCLGLYAFILLNLRLGNILASRRFLGFRIFAFLGMLCHFVLAPYSVLRIFLEADSLGHLVPLGASLLLICWNVLTLIHFKNKLELADQKDIPHHINRQIAEHYDLTRKEREILQWILEGYTSKGIAEKVYLSHQTVKNYTHRAYRKMGINNKIGLVNLLKQKGKGN